MSASRRKGADAAPRPTTPERELADVDRVFRALAHPTRRHVLLVLHFRGGSLGAGAIAERFACSWPTTSRHLAVLRDAGLVVVASRGRERVYRLDRERLAAVAGGWLASFDTPPLVPAAGTGLRAPAPRPPPGPPGSTTRPAP